MLKFFDKRPFMWATHLWNMFDFAADARNQGGEPGMNHKGLVTFDRQTKKDSFYVYKAWWSRDPFVYIAGRRYVDRAERKTTIKVYSNCPEVTLYVNGEKFATLARIYSQDPGSARKGGELGMASKSIFWPAFSDAAMSLKPGVVSQIVETPDGFHLIEVLEKKGDMFNARHILLKPEYTSEDREKAFGVLDSLKTELANEAVTFELAARFYSEDPATRTNGGQMADPNSGSSYFEIDQLKPQDYAAIKTLEAGQISEPFESLDNEGRNGNTVYKIIKVDKIIPSHTASFNNDYDLLLSQAKNKKAMEAIDEFISSKIKSTHIIIDPLFKDCEFEREGWESKFRK
jgi:peptidyl-prolyl cis-trans isomerase SurA